MKGEFIINKSLTLIIVIFVILTLLAGCSTPSSDTTSEVQSGEEGISEKTTEELDSDIIEDASTVETNGEETDKETDEEEISGYQPVRIGTPFPSTQKEITLENASEVIELADYGNIFVLPQVTDDGKYIFIASELGVDIFDTETDELIRHIDTKIRSNYQSGDMGISATGNYFFVIEENALQVFSFQGENLLTLPPASSAAISPDGKIVAVSGETSFQIINIIDEEEIYTWDGNEDTLHGDKPVFSMDGSTLATWFGKRIWFWDTANWQKIRDVWLERASSNQCSWTLSNDASYLAIACDEVVEIYNLVTGVLVRTIEGFTEQELKSNQVIFSPDGETMGVLEPGNIVSLWVRSTGKRLSNFLETSIQTSSLIKVTNDGKIIDYKLPPGDATSWAGYRIPLTLQFLSDNSGLIFQNTIIESKYGITGIEEICTLKYNERPYCFRDYDLIMSSDENYFSITTYKDSGYFKSYSLDGETEDISKFGVTTKYSRVYLLGYIEKENLLFFTNWNDVYGKGDSFVFDIEKRDMARNWKDGFIRRVVFSDDFQYSAFFVQKETNVELIIMDNINRTILYKDTYDWCTRWCTILDFASDNSALIYSAGHGSATGDEWYPLSYLSLEEPFEVKSIPYSHWPLMLELSPNNKILAVALGGGTIALLNTEDGTVLNSWRAYENQEISSLAFSSDGTVFASSSNSQDIKIWGLPPDN